MRANTIKPSFRKSVPPPGVTITDDAIVDGIVAGERWAADELYKRTNRFVAGTLRRIIGGTPQEQEDLLQTVYEKLVRSLEQGRFEKACRLSTWASRIAANTAIDAIRARVKERRVFSDMEDSDPVIDVPAPSTERRLEHRSELKRVQHALSRVNPKHAAAVVLHDFHGYRVAEIAELTGVSRTAAQSRLVRGRKSALDKIAALAS